jgi:hypothetical protein
MVEQFGLAMIPSWSSRSPGLTSLTTSGYARLHAPCRGVVDDGGAACRRLRRKIPRDVRAGAEQGDVHALERLARLANLDRPASD